MYLQTFWYCLATNVGLSTNIGKEEEKIYNPVYIYTYIYLSYTSKMGSVLFYSFPLGVSWSSINTLEYDLFFPGYQQLLQSCSHQTKILTVLHEYQ